MYSNPFSFAVHSLSIVELSPLHMSVMFCNDFSSMDTAYIYIVTILIHLLILFSFILMVALAYVGKSVSLGLDRQTSKFCLSG